MGNCRAPRGGHVSYKFPISSWKLELHHWPHTLSIVLKGNRLNLFILKTIAAKYWCPNHHIGSVLLSSRNCPLRKVSAHRSVTQGQNLIKLKKVCLFEHILKSHLLFFFPCVCSKEEHNDCSIWARRQRFSPSSSDTSLASTRKDNNNCANMKMVLPCEPTTLWDCCPGIYLGEKYWIPHRVGTCQPSRMMPDEAMPTHPASRELFLLCILTDTWNCQIS